MYEDLVAKLNQVIPIPPQMLMYGNILNAFYEKEKSGLCDKPHIVLDWPKSESYNAYEIVKAVLGLINKVFPHFECKIHDNTQYWSLYVASIEKGEYDLASLTEEKIAETKAVLRKILPKEPTETERCFTKLTQLVPAQISDGSSRLYGVKLDPAANVVVFSWEKIASGRLWLERLRKFLTQFDEASCNFIEAGDRWELKISLTEGIKSALRSEQWGESVSQFHEDVGLIWDKKQAVENELAERMVSKNELPKPSELTSMQGINPLQIGS